MILTAPPSTPPSRPVPVADAGGVGIEPETHGEWRAAGVPERTRYAVAVWREAPFFTPSERAALQLAESLTLLATGPVPDAAYAEAAAHFPGQLLAQLVIVITAINAWNRVMLASGQAPAEHAE